MSLTRELTAALLDAYRRAGEEVGYWGERFRQAVHRNGGLATVKRMLKPRSAQERKGLDALLEAGRPDLTVESVILDPRFAPLFTEDELAEARRRLGLHKAEAATRRRKRERLYPDELEPGQRYSAGARKQVRVNAYERDPRARQASLHHHGYRCTVCDISFPERYGALGRGFIHVHHVRPLALASEAYEIDPIADLIPVCPNCHAMLHRKDPVLTVKELRRKLRQRAD